MGYHLLDIKHLKIKSQHLSEALHTRIKTQLPDGTRKGGSIKFDTICNRKLNQKLLSPPSINFKGAPRTLQLQFFFVINLPH